MIFSIVAAKLPTFQIWCLVGDSNWQDDTRIIRHRKLLKRLQSRGTGIRHSTHALEAMVEREGKLKFFSAIHLSELSISSAVNTLTLEPCSYVVAVPESFDIGDALAVGWEASDVLDLNLINKLVSGNGLLFKLVGTFDDPETGFVGFGAPVTVRKLVE